MLSMTGYGDGKCQRHGKQISVLANSVNRRQLDLRISLPRALAFLERDFRERLKHQIQRGVVTVLVDYCEEGGELRETRLNLPLAKSCWRHLQTLQQELGLDKGPTLGDLLAVPEIFTLGASELPEDELRSMALEALDAAIAGLMASRKTEGEALQADLEQRRRNLAEILDQISALAPRVPQHYREKLLQRLREFDAKLPVDDDRLLKEVLYFADRADVTEEITRLASHLEQMRQIFAAAGPVGRKLEFVVQELMREINTVGAKGSDQEIAVCAVEFKSELERIREQVQNIE